MQYNKKVRTSLSISAISSLEKDSRGLMVSMNRPEGVRLRRAATGAGAGGGLLQCAGGRRELLCGEVI